MDSYVSTADELELKEEEHDERARRSSVLLLLLLLLTPLCLCCVGQLALTGISPREAGMPMESALAANYNPWDRFFFQPVDPSLIDEIRADQLTAAAPGNFADLLQLLPFIPDGQPPTSIAAANTPTQLPTSITSTPVATSTAQPSVTPILPTPLPTVMQVPSATAIPPTAPPPTGGGGSSPTNTPVPNIAISGFVRVNDGYAGGAGTDGAVCNSTGQGVTVTISPPGTSTTTDANCRYQFTGLAPNTVYTISLSAPQNGPNGEVPVQIFERGNGATGAMGGNDHTAPDPGNYTLTVNAGTASINNANFAFAYNVVTNTNNAGRGSLRQALLNANLPGAGISTITFSICETCGAGSRIISPGAPLPAIGATGLEVKGNSQDMYAAGSDVVIDGASAGATADGLIVNADGVSIHHLTIQNYNYRGILITNSDGVVVQYVTMDRNIATVSANRGQIQIDGMSANGTIAFCQVLDGNGDGIRFNDITITGWLITDNYVSGNDNNPANEAILIRGSGNLVRHNIVTLNAVGIAVRDASPSNEISQNSTYNNTGLGIDVNFGGIYPVAGTPNEQIAPPTLGPLGGLDVTVVNPNVAAANSVVEFFATDGDGEGRYFCGAQNLAGVGPLSVTLPAVCTDVAGIFVPLGSGSEIVATITDAALKNTSRFSVPIALP